MACVSRWQAGKTTLLHSDTNADLKLPYIHPLVPDRCIHLTSLSGVSVKFLNVLAQALDFEFFHS
jgi:hypothetical protein